MKYRGFMAKDFAGLGIGLAAFALVIGGLLYVFQGQAQPQPQSVWTPQGFATIQPTPANLLGVSAGCQAGGNDLLVTVKNKENSALEFLGSTVYVESGELGAGALQDKDTATGGTSPTQTKLTANCGSRGYIYSLGSTTYVGGRVQYSANDIRSSYEIPASNATRPVFFIYHANMSNASALIAGTEGYTVATDAITMTTGNSWSGHIYMNSNQSSMQFGSDDGGVMFAISLPQKDAISENAVSLSSNSGSYPLVKQACPAEYVSFDNAAPTLCYRAPAYKSSTGLVDLILSIRADVGNPTIADSPVVYIEAIDYVLDTSGKVKLGTFDTSGTRQTALNGNLTIELA